MKATSKNSRPAAAGDNENEVSPRAYAGIVGTEDDLYRACWIEPTGDMIIRHSPLDVSRMHSMATTVRKILHSHHDPELEDIKDGIDFCIDTVQHVIETFYEKRRFKSNA